MSEPFREIASAARSLRRAPGVTLLAVGILAVGIGANTAIFSVVDAVLLRPLPFPEADRVVRIWATAPERGLDLAEVSHARFLDVSSRNASFEAIGAFTPDSVTLTAPGTEPLRIAAARVSRGVLDVLGVRPKLGRNFLPEEDRPGGPDAVLLGARLWRGRFGADPRVVGGSVDLDGRARTVVGVLPDGLGFPDDETELWIPRVDAPNFLNPGNVERGSTYLSLVARRKPGMTDAAIRADLDRLAGNRRSGYLDEGLRYRFLSFREAATRDARPLLLLLLGAVALVLLIACANVTNLLLVRAIERRREVAVRKALGASRGRLVRQFLVESLLLAGAAAVAGVALARAALPALAALAARQKLPRAGEIGLDLRVLAFASAAAFLTGIVFGIVPAFPGAATDIRAALAETSRTALGSARRRRGRGFLVVAEVALAVVLLTGAGLLFRTILRLEAVDPGFRRDHLVVAAVDLPPSRYSKPEDIRAFFERLRESFASIPGVDAVGAAQALPLSADRPQTLVAAEGGLLPPLSERPIVSLDTVAFDYFRTLGIPLRAGRTFADADDASAPMRLVVNRSFARRFFPGRDAVGRRVFVGRSPKPSEIIGVVGDVRSDGLDAAPRESFYLSARQHTVSTLRFVLRSRAPLSVLAPTLRARLRALDPAQPLSDLRSMDDVVAESIGPRRRIGLLLGVFAGIAVALAAIGLFAVMACSVRQRSAEIGVRIALGAEPRRILGATVAEGLRLAAIGLGAGLAASAALTRSIASLLFETRPVDPATVGAISFFLLAVAAAASWIPARRAARTDPIRVLMEE